MTSGAIQPWKTANVLDISKHHDLLLLTMFSLPLRHKDSKMHEEVAYDLLRLCEPLCLGDFVAIPSYLIEF